MHPVVKLEGIVGFLEVSFGQFIFMLCFDRIKQLCLSFLVFGKSGFVSFERFVVSFFCLQEGPLGHGQKDNGQRKPQRNVIFVFMKSSSSFVK